MRALTREELSLAAWQFPHISLSSRMSAVEPTAVKGGIARRVTRQSLVLGWIVTGRRLLPFFVPGRNGAPAQQQRASLENFLLGQLELDSKVGHRHATMAINGRQNAIGTRDVGRVHTADGGIPTKQQRGHTELGADTMRSVMDVKAARQTQKELGHANATGTRRQKVAALMQKHKDGKHQKAPKDR